MFLRHRAIGRFSVALRGQLLNEQDITECQTLGHPDSRPKPRNMANICRAAPSSGDNRIILCFTGQLHLIPQVDRPKYRAKSTLSGCILSLRDTALPLQRVSPNPVDNLTDSRLCFTRIRQLWRETADALKVIPKEPSDKTRPPRTHRSLLVYVRQKSRQAAPKADPHRGTSTSNLWCGSVLHSRNRPARSQR